nr:MAG TPA: hypothetical protein [Caudoviricetes sp.]
MWIYMVGIISALLQIIIKQEELKGEWIWK